MSVLLDTNVLSELARPRPSAAVSVWVGELTGIRISVVTVEELFYGLTRNRNARIQRWFEAFIDSYCTVLDITPPITRHAGVLRGQLAARGRVRSQADMLIAATAALHGLTVATRNERDFDDCGVTVVNPFVTRRA
jgi:predicted nucleic acid-binding protein